MSCTLSFSPGESPHPLLTPLQPTPPLTFCRIQSSSSAVPPVLHSDTRIHAPPSSGIPPDPLPLHSSRFPPSYVALPRPHRPRHPHGPGEQQHYSPLQLKYKVKPVEINMFKSLNKESKLTPSHSNRRPSRGFSRFPSCYAKAWPCPELVSTALGCDPASIS